MFPFLRAERPGDEMLFQQKAAMGNQNMIKMVALWGIYTAIVSIYTFAKKKFRMVSVLLIICWFISIATLVFLNKRDSTMDRCMRPEPYVAPKEVDRALDIIEQRMNILDTNQGYLSSAFDYRNCLNIQYATSDSELSGNEGGLIVNHSDLNNIQILLNPKYKEYDDLTIATILAHELTHVGQMVYEKKTNTSIECFQSEAEAFTSQIFFTTFLNAEEQRSISARILQDSEENPSFRIMLEVTPLVQTADIACRKLKSSQDPQKLSTCVWDESIITVEQSIRDSGAYDEQCANSE